MSRGERNLTEEEWAQFQRDKNMPTTPTAIGILESTSKGRAHKSSTSKMNRWETEYSYELEARKQAGEIIWYGFESIKLRLTGGTFYTPDFATLWLVDALSKPVMRFIEVKGFLRDDANVKFKVAAELFPAFEFVMIRKQKGGGWKVMKHLNGGRA